MGDKIPELKESDKLELKRIQESIPQELKDRVLRKVPKYDKIRFTLTKALEDPNLPPDKREAFETLLGSSVMPEDAVEHENDPDTALEIDKYLGVEIRKSIKAGTLSKPPVKLWKRKQRKKN